jgi:hypothetical protein
MIKKLFSLLGYVPKEDLKFAEAQLDSMMGAQKSLTEIQANIIKNYKKTSKAAETALKTAMTKIKQLNAKNLRLLRKQGEFKEQIKELNQRNEDLFSEALELKDQAYYYKLISEAALEKLEYLCFGSVLPKALRPSSLDRYQHLYKPVTPTYFKDRYGRPTIGVEYGQSED